MTALDIIVVVVPALMIVGAIVAPVLSRRGPSRLHAEPLLQRGGVVDARPSNQQQPIQLLETGLDVESMGESASGAGEGDQYLTDWTALQDKFCG